MGHLMADRYILGRSLAQATRLVEALDALHGYPSPGVQGGGGRQVPMPSSWDGTGPVPPGWTKGHEPIQHPTNATQYRIVVRGDVASRAAEPTARGRVPANRIAELDAAVSAAVDTLPSEWRV